MLVSRRLRSGKGQSESKNNGQKLYKQNRAADQKYLAEAIVDGAYYLVDATLAVNNVKIDISPDIQSRRRFSAHFVGDVVLTTALRDAEMALVHCRADYYVLASVPVGRVVRSTALQLKRNNNLIQHSEVRISRKSYAFLNGVESRSALFVLVIVLVHGVLDGSPHDRFQALAVRVRPYSGRYLGNDDYQHYAEKLERQKLSMLAECLVSMWLPRPACNATLSESRSSRKTRLGGGESRLLGRCRARWCSCFRLVPGICRRWGPLASILRDLPVPGLQPATQIKHGIKHY